MSKLNAKDLIKISLISALYIVLTLVLGDFSFGAIQFRVAEILLLMCLFDKRYAYGLIIGCLISNIFSPLGLIDVLFGSIATALTVIAISKSKNVYIACLFPAIFNLIIGVELHIVMELPLLITCLEVFLGELGVMYIIGLPLYLTLKKNNRFMELIKLSGGKV